MAYDYARLAAEQSRDEFIAACAFPFLVGAARLVQPVAPRKTGRFDAVASAAALIGGGVGGGGGPFGGDRTSVDAEPRGPAARPMVVPVRKVQDLFPNMITVGRTRNNDVVLEDVLISKFHAFFRRQPAGAWELCDAGSANGTRVGAATLAVKGAARIVPFGARVGFAQLDFEFLDAGACWDKLRAPPDPASNE